MPVNPNEIMHADELNEWLKPYAELSGQNIDDVLSDVKAIWKEGGELLSSDKLAVNLTEQYLQQKNITPEAQQKILADVADIEALKRFPDHTTGVLAKDHKGVETALSDLYAKETGRPVAMFEFDFGNMGGTNELFQEKFAVQDYAQANGINDLSQAQKQFDALDLEIRKGLIADINIKRTFDSTDKAAKIVTQSVLTDLQAHYPDSNVTAIRTGGDELRFIVEGADPATYQDVIMAATHNVEIKMGELGLLDHEHAKGRDNKFKNGFGGGIAVEDMRNINDPENIIAKMDIAVKDHKNSIGEMRANDHIDINARVRQNMGIAADADLSQLSSERQAAFNNAIAEQKSTLQKNADNIRAHSPSPASTITEYNERSAQILSTVDNTATPNVDNPALRSAANVDELDTNTYDTIEQRRVAYMEQVRIPDYVAANNGQAIDSSVTQFMKQESRSLNPIDPSAKVSTISDFTENTTLWHAASAPDNPPRALFVGFQNLGGLNDLLGHDGADAVLKDMANIVQESLEQAGIEKNQYVIAHNGGGEFRVLVQPGLENQVALAQETIGKQTALLNNQPIDAYMKAKDIDLDAATSQKIDGLAFTDVQDPKVRTTIYNGEELQHRINGLEVISTTAPIEIEKGAPNKAWTPGHALGYMKDNLEAVATEFRHNKILEANGITPTPEISKHFSAASLSAETATPAVETSLKQTASATPNLGDISPNVAGEAVDSLADGIKGARKLITAGRIAKLGIITGVAVTGGVAGLLHYVHETQREDAKGMLEEGKISQEAYDEYIELNNDVEIMMQAENAGAQGWLFIASTPLVELDASKRFEEFAKRHSDIPQELLDKLNVSMLDHVSERGKFGQEIFKSLPENIDEASPELKELIEAKQAVNDARVAHSISGIMVHGPSTQQDTAQEDLAQAKQHFEDILKEQFNDPSTAQEILNFVPEEDKRKLAVTIARHSADIDTTAPELLRINERQEKIENTQGNTRGAAAQRISISKEIKAIGDKLEANPEIIDNFLLDELDSNENELNAEVQADLDELNDSFTNAAIKQSNGTTPNDQQPPSGPPSTGPIVPKGIGEP